MPRWFPDLTLGWVFVLGGWALVFAGILVLLDRGKRRP